MGKPKIGGLGLLIALVAVLSTDIVLARLIDTSTENVPSPDRMSAIVHDRSAACGTTARPEFNRTATNREVKSMASWWLKT